jgi:hypothetical protein
MNSLHYTKGIFKKFSPLLIGGSVVLIIAIIYFADRGSKQATNSQINDSTSVTFTPYPTVFKPQRSLAPTETKVVPQGPFDSYTLDSRFKSVSADDLPPELARTDTRVYINDAEGQPQENLRISVVNNASNITLSQFVEEQKKGFVVSNTRSYKYDQYNASSIYFKGSDNKSVARTTVVYIPSSFYVFSYSQALDGRTENEVYALVDTFLDDFINSYNWNVVFEASGPSYDISPRYDSIQNEIDYQRGSEEPKP